MQTGRYLMQGLEKLKQKFPLITDVRGRGLLIAVEFKRNVAQSIVLACLDKGLLINKVKPNAIRLMPPLIIGEQEVDQALGILETALDSTRLVEEVGKSH